MNRFLSLFALLLAAMSVLHPAPAGADPADIDAATRGVVRVVIIGNDGEEIFPISHGTGFSVGGERIVTNAHVVQQAIADDRLAIGIVPADGDRAVYARLVAVSVRNDLALLETTEPLGLPPLTIAGNPAQSGAVTAIGYPLNVDRAQGLSFSDMFRAQPPVTATGSLAGRRPSREMDTLLHTAPIAAGNSGGPLVDNCGRVVGVKSFGTQSEGSDAEFFFAVSTRELLPFLRANNVTPRLNAAECRSLAELDAEERARRAESQSAADRAAAAENEASAERTAELRRTIGYEVMAERDNGLAMAFLLLLLGIGAGAIAAFGHIKHDLRLRAAAGGVALVAVIAAGVAWFTRPSFATIDHRVEDALRASMAEADSGAIALTNVADEGSYTCVLDTTRSRVVGDPEEDIPLAWSADGCVNGRTQYALDSGAWTRVFVPTDEAAVSINRFDPEAGELVMERYLLDRTAMSTARTARGDYRAPSCGAGEESARELGSHQSAITANLPQDPNERLVYRCEVASTSAVGSE